MAAHHHHHHGHADHEHGHAHGHGHGHGEGHLHAHGGAAGRFSLGLALILTLVYGAIEFVGGWWFGSLALMSDAGHMVSDAAALGLAAFASWVSRRPPGEKHSFGLARAEVIAAFVNGLAMLLVIVLIAVEAVKRLLEPGEVQGLGVMVIAFIGLLINLAVAYVLSRGARSLNQRAALLHVLGDLAGSFAALLAGAVIYFSGWQPIDPILSLVIGVLILVSTFQLLREALHVLMEGVPLTIRLDSVGNALARIPGVRNVHDLHIWHISSGQVSLSAHLQVNALDRWPAILSASRQLLEERFGIRHVTLQPELSDAGEQAVIQIIRRR